MPGKLVNMQIAYTSDSEYIAKGIYKALPEILTKRLEIYEDLLRRATSDRESYLKTTREPPPTLRDRREDIQRYLEEVYGGGFDDFCKLEKEEMFGNKEYKPKFSNVRGRDVFLITSFKGYEGEDEPNVGYMKLFMCMDALKRASAKERIIVAPYMPYQRQDRKDESRVPISFKAIADILESLGTTRLLTMDMHAPQEQGFFNFPVDDLTPINIFKPVIEQIQESYPVVIADPDAGSAKRNEYLIAVTKVPEVIVDKERKDYMPKTKEIRRVGQIPGSAVLIVDDLIGSGRTVINTVNEVKAYKPAKIYVLGTHMLGNPSKISDAETGFDKLQNCIDIEKVYVTDSNYSPKWMDYPKVKVLSTDELLADAIFETQVSGSVTRLFPKRD